MRIVIVNYGMGNIKSITSTLNFLGVEEVLVSNNYPVLKNADKLILPGVGSFSKAMSKIIENRIDDQLHELVMIKKKPLLGICLGMQLLCNSSTEDGFNNGLSFINANVTKFDCQNIKIPHVGFNQVEKDDNSILFKNICNGSDFYFTHSYKVTSNEHLNQSICHYGQNFISSFEFENIFGTQFHPELSQNNGLKLLKNFITL
uniref:imidazole glycerol phosphate synthase subunit HisH n=1 Tax=Algoriphagus sp. TaxID=1872435 RepID=UPI00404763C2